MGIKGLIFVVGVPLAISCAAVLVGLILVLVCGLFHWLSITDVFHTHPFISYFVLWVVLFSVLYPLVDFVKKRIDSFRNKEKKEIRKTRLP